MQTTASHCPTGSDDLHGSNEFGAGGAAVQAVDSTSDTRTPGCPNCGAQSYSGGSWCKYCGYYALLGQCVELADWERDYENGEYVGIVAEPQAAWLRIPGWAWQVAAALIGVGGMSFAGHHLTFADSTPRLAWSLCQVGVGLAAFLLAHIFVAKSVLAHDANLRLADAIITPMRVWIAACLDFQRSSRWIVIGIAGIWAVILAHVLLGVPYGRLFTHEEPPRKKKTPAAAAVPKAAGKGGKQMTMEEAMDEFANKSGAKQMAQNAKSAARPKGPLAGAKDAQENTPEIRELDCLIVGYRPGVEGDSSISTLVVAIQTSGKWNVVGTVSDGLTPEIQRDLSTSAKPLHREKPFVECNYSAVWLEPVLRCRVEAEYPPGESKPSKLKLVGLK